MKKKVFLVILAALMVLTLSACSKNPIEGKWKYVSGEAEALSQYGENFSITFAGGKMTFDIDFSKMGLTGEALTAAQAMMKAITITYKIKSATEIEMTVSFMGQTQTQTVQYKIEGNKLTFDGAVFQKQ